MSNDTYTKQAVMDAVKKLRTNRNVRNISVQPKAHHIIVEYDTWIQKNHVLPGRWVGVRNVFPLAQGE